MATAKPMPPIVAQAFEQVMPESGNVFNLWIKQYVIDILNSIGVDVTDLDTSVSSIGTSVDSLDTSVATLSSEKAEANHNHNLNDLTEKSYNSLNDKPTIPAITEADVVADGPTAVAVSALSAATGSDTINRTALNISLTTLVTEINNLKDDINSLTTVHDDLIDKLQAAGIMGS